MDKGKIISKEEFIKRVSSHFDAQDPDGEIHQDLKLLIKDGYDRNHIQILVEEYLKELQGQNREKEEDIMTNVLTYFIGWSAKEWQL